MVSDVGPDLPIESTLLTKFELESFLGKLSNWNWIRPLNNSAKLGYNGHMMDVIIPYLQLVELILQDPQLQDMPSEAFRSQGGLLRVQILKQLWIKT